nr:hypothetical protein pmam_219 [Pithovirus mammoth]
MNRSPDEEPYLPLEIRQLISSSLSVEDILRLCSTNPQWRRVCQDETFWRDITFRDFPVPWYTQDQKSWKQIYRQNSELSRINVEGKVVYLVFVQTDLAASTFPFVSEEDSNLYFWLKNFLRLRYAMTYIPGNLDPIEGTLTALPDVVRYNQEVSSETQEPFIRFYYSVSIPGAQTELDLYNWLSKLQSLIIPLSDSYLEVIMTEDEEPPQQILQYEYSEMDRRVIIQLNNEDRDSFSYDDQSRLFFEKGNGNGFITQIYY